MTSEAFSAFTQSVSRLSSWRPGFNPRPDLVGFSLDKVALGQSFLLSVLFYQYSLVFDSCFTDAI
jgi:hypothetical protein